MAFRALSTLAAALLLIIFNSCGHTPDYRIAAGSAWGTTYHVTYQSDADLADTIVTVVGIIDSSLSPFKANSLITRINAADSGVRADSVFADVFAVSRHVNAISGGAFDPTLGPLISMWGFGPGVFPDDGPDQAQIDTTLAMVGIADCAILPDGTVKKKHPGTQFNFSAIAKGYGVDCIARALEKAGVQNYMVEVGGEIAVKGRNPRGEEWVIQVDAPIPSDEIEHHRLVLLDITDRAVATSGNYRNYRRTNDGSVGHTISPLTGRPVKSPTLSATVIAPDCTLADALATACMALPADSALAMVEKYPGVEALLVLTCDTAAFETRPTSGFANYIAK